MDIGFGNGYLIKKLMEQNSTIKIYGIEISNDMFDKIYTVNTLYFWNELEECFAEIKRILKPNGIFMNVIYTKEYLDKIIYTKYGFKKYTVEEITKITEKNEMKIIETIEIKKNKSYCMLSEKMK